MALLGGGCVVDGGPLPEAAIDGATPSQREVLEGELDRFDLHAGRGRVRLASVALDDDVEAVEGTPGVYDHRRKALRVDGSLEGEELATAVRHLLCHALDLQLVRSWETLASELAPHVEAVSGVYPEGYVDDLRRAPPMTTSERDLAETFAGFCDEGAEVARLLAVSCPGDPETETETASAWAAVSSSAWRGGGDFTRSAQPATETVQWPVDEVVSPDEVESMNGAAAYSAEWGAVLVVLLYAPAALGSTVVLLDPYTGESVASSEIKFETGDGTIDEPFGSDRVRVKGTGYVDGASRGVAEVRPAGGDHTFRRGVVRPAASEAWLTSHGGCLQHLRGQFLLDEEAWALWLEPTEGSLVWAKVR